MTIFLVTYAFFALVYATSFYKGAQRQKIKLTQTLWFLLVISSLLWPASLGYGIYLHIKDK